MKKYIVPLLSALVILGGLTTFNAFAAPITPITGGGTQTSTLPGIGSVAGSNGVTFCYTPSSTTGFILEQSSTSPCGLAWIANTGSGGSGSSTTLYGTAGVSTTPLVAGAQTSSLDTAYAAQWSSLETFLKGATINGTTTLASTTSAIILTNGSGTVLAYTGTTCGAGQAPNGFSATGTFTGCITFLQGNQTITLTGAVTGSGATTIATTFTTSTLYGLFSAGTGINFSSTTGAITNIGVTSLIQGGCVTVSNATGTVTLGSTCLTGTKVDSFNGSTGAINFNVIGTGNVTTTVATSGGNSTTTTTLINSGVASGTYNWANITVASSGIVTAATANSTPVTSFNGNTGATTYAVTCTSGCTTATTTTSTALTVTATGSGTISTSSAPVTNTLPIWTGTSTLGNSVVSQSGTSTFIGASSTYLGATTSTAISSLVWLGNGTGGGYWDATGTIPTISSCGTSPTSTGNQWRGRITVGSVAATACTMTFPIPFVKIPSLIVSEETESITNSLSYVVTTSTVVFSQTGLTGNILDYDVVGQNE